MDHLRRLPFIACVALCATACDDDASRRASLETQALQRLESRPQRSDVPPAELHEANVALARDVAALAADAAASPPATAGADDANRDRDAQQRAIAAECTELGYQVDAQQRTLKTADAAGGDAADLAALQQTIAATQARIASLCR